MSVTFLLALGVTCTICSVIAFFIRAWNEMNVMLLASMISWMAFFYRLVGGS